MELRGEGKKTFHSANNAKIIIGKKKYIYPNIKLKYKPDSKRIQRTPDFSVP